jgi:hypothetical protein
MAAKPYTATAGSDGKASITVSPLLSGIQWTVGQTSVESIPIRTGASCTESLNGNLVTNTQIIPSAASGSPAINLQANDKLTFDFAGLTAGDTAKVTIYYNESEWGTPPNYAWV